MADSSLQAWDRYVAIDNHKHYVFVGAIDAQQRIVPQPRRGDLPRFAAWASAISGPRMR